MTSSSEDTPARLNVGRLELLHSRLSALRITHGAYHGMFRRLEELPTLVAP